MRFYLDKAKEILRVNKNIGFATFFFFSVSWISLGYVVGVLPFHRSFSGVGRPSPWILHRPGGRW